MVIYIPLDKNKLDSKRNAYYSISILYQKPLSKLTPNYMNMFDQTHAFVLGHCFRHYTVNFIFLLIDVKKKLKTVPYVGRAMF